MFNIRREEIGFGEHSSQRAQPLSRGVGAGTDTYAGTYAVRAGTDFQL